MATHGTTMETAGARIRDLRRARGWSGTDLGERVGLSRKGISKIERGGSTTTDTLDAIAGALGVRAADLLCDAPSVHPSSKRVPASVGKSGGRGGFVRRVRRGMSDKSSNRS